MSSSSSPESLSPTYTAPLSLSARNSPPTDLKHITSQNGLTYTKDTQRVSSRASQHIPVRLGSRSPSSIPSSPTSVHSSSSAIFERDIEPIASHSPPNTSHGLHPPNPHRIPRSKATEQLEQSVPSVLDSAAAILTSSLSLADEDQIAVVTPTNGNRSGVASPIGSFRSRSPSPLGSKASNAANRASLLLSIPGASQHPVSAYQTYIASPFPQSARSPSPISQIPSPLATARPTINTNIGQSSGTPSIVTPTSAYYSTASSAESSPATTTVEHPPQTLPSSRPTSTIFPTSTLPITLSHPPSPTHIASKRLSFMSYSDLLTSTPASMLPLSSLTSSATNEPPPHIPSVSGLTQMQAASHSSAASVHGMSVKEGDALDDVIGGEWEREGLGRGLEERLEALMAFDVKA